jgi:hypothetical protein
MSKEEKLLALLKLALPALRVSVILGRSKLSKEQRKWLVDEVAAAINAESNGTAGAPHCSNTECDDGSVEVGYCPTCDQAISKTCPACKGNRSVSTETSAIPDKTPCCGAEWLWRKIGGMRVYRELEGRKVYDAKCGQCQGMHVLDGGPYETHEG